MLNYSSFLLELKFTSSAQSGTVNNNMYRLLHVENSLKNGAEKVKLLQVLIGIIMHLFLHMIKPTYCDRFSRTP